MGLEAWFLIVPILTYGVLAYSYKQKLRWGIPPGRGDRELTRGVVLPMAGFSFTGLIGLLAVIVTIANPTDRTRILNNVQPSVVYLLASFLLYLGALNIQSYKEWRWLSLFSNFLIDTASLLLLLSIIAAIRATGASCNDVTLIGLGSLLVWSVNHAVLIYINNNSLKKVQPPTSPTTLHSTPTHQ